MQIFATESATVSCVMESHQKLRQPPLQLSPSPIPVVKPHHSLKWKCVAKKRPATCVSVVNAAATSPWPLSPPQLLKSRTTVDLKGIAGGSIVEPTERRRGYMQVCHKAALSERPHNRCSDPLCSRKSKRSQSAQTQMDTSGDQQINTHHDGLPQNVDEESPSGRRASSSATYRLQEQLSSREIYYDTSLKPTGIFKFSTDYQSFKFPLNIVCLLPIGCRTCRTILSFCKTVFLSIITFR